MIKRNDIYRWRYTENELVGKSYPYHCKSQICICDENKGNNRKYLIDTYWGSGGNESFAESDIGTKIEIEFIANLDDLIECKYEDFKYYKRSDCIDISHSNRPNIGYYLKKDAKKDLETMREHIDTQRKKLERDLEYYQNKLEDLHILDKELTTESYLPTYK